MSNAVQKKALSAKAVISWAVTILVPVVLLLIPTSETYTSQLRIFFALTICAILMFAFDQVHSAIPALLLPLAYALTGLVPFGTAMAPWTQPVVWIVFGCFLIAAIYDRVGILRRVAYWAIVRTGATYKGIIYGFFLAGLILNLLVPSAWVCMVFLALGRSICEAFRLGKSRAACGIYMSAILGYMEAQLFVYAPTQVGVALGAAGIQVSYFDFLKQNIALVPLFVILCLMIPRLMKPEQEINGRVYFQAEYEKLGRMTGDEIKCLVVALLLIVFLFTTQFHGLDPVYGFLVAPAILFFPGMRVAKKEDFAGVNLSTLVFVGGCMAIGSVANAVGAGQFIANALTPILSSTGAYGFTLLSYVFGFVINFALTPLAAMTALSAPLADIANGLGVNPAPVLYSYVLGLDNLLLPYESGMHLVAFSFGGMYLKDFAKLMGVKALVMLAYLAVIGIPFWMLIGLL